MCECRSSAGRSCEKKIKKTFWSGFSPLHLHVFIAFLVLECYNEMPRTAAVSVFTRISFVGIWTCWYSFCWCCWFHWLVAFAYHWWWLLNAEIAVPWQPHDGIIMNKYNAINLKQSDASLSRRYMLTFLCSDTIYSWGENYAGLYAWTWNLCTNKCLFLTSTKPTRLTLSHPTQITW